MRGKEDFVAVFIVFVAPPVFERHAEAASLGVPVNEAGTRVLLGGEEIEFFTELPVVAFFRFREEVQVVLEFVRLLESVAIYAGQHGTLLVAAPVGTGDLYELESLRVEFFGGRDMGAAAEVAEGALFVHRNDLAFGKLVYEFELHRLIGEQFFRFFPAYFPSGELAAFVDDLAHGAFDRREILVGDGAGEFHVVIESVIDRGTDSELGAGEKNGDRFGHDMRQGVPYGLQCLVCFVTHNNLQSFRHERFRKQKNLRILRHSRIRDHLILENLSILSKSARTKDPKVRYASAVPPCFGLP